MPVRYIAFEKQAGQIRFKREIILKTGEVVEQICQMPETTFSIRAGEYGLDVVKDADAIWDMILNETHMNADDYDEPESPLVYAETLEHAQTIHLERCRAQKKKLDSRHRPTPWTAKEKKDHDEVLAAIKQHSPADAQVAILHRDATKKAVKYLKARTPNTTAPIDKLRREMIDVVRHEGGV